MTKKDAQNVHFCNRLRERFGIVDAAVRERIARLIAEGRAILVESGSSLVQCQNAADRATHYGWRI